MLNTHTHSSSSSSSSSAHRLRRTNREEQIAWENSNSSSSSSSSNDEDFESEGEDAGKRSARERKLQNQLAAQKRKTSALEKQLTELRNQALLQRLPRYVDDL